MRLSTKARTLASLLGHLQTAEVADLVFFTVHDWKRSKDWCLSTIQEKIAGDLYIVRSSCGLEDGDGDSHAGEFLSIPNVVFSNLQASIERVIDSYVTAKDDDEVLVQAMLTNVVRSGVAFSHDPNTYAPYRIINWSEGADTAAITSGIDGRIWRQVRFKAPPLQLFPILRLLDELLKKFDQKPIDIEFAVTKNGDTELVWLLQARPLNLTAEPESCEAQEKRLKIIENKVSASIGAHPFYWDHGQSLV